MCFVCKPALRILCENMANDEFHKSADQLADAEKKLRLANDLFLVALQPCGWGESHQSPAAEEGLHSGHEGRSFPPPPQS